MCSYPGGNRGPGNAFSNHWSALTQSKFFEIELISEAHLKDISLFEKYDVFWFSVRFHPSLYFFIKSNFPNKKIIMGPNVLFEKPEIGLSDDWERWFVENVKCDLYLNKADFYLEYAKNIFKGSEKYQVLANCIETSQGDNSIATINDKTDKVLVYAKKRRIDKQYDRLFPEFLKKLKSNNINFDVVEYGNYQKKDLLNTCGNYRACFWFSIEDYCSNAQLEIQSIGTPIIGTGFNTTHTFDRDFNVDGSNFGPWITWKENISDLYIEKYKSKLQQLSDKNNQIFKKVKDYVGDFHSYDFYAKNLTRMLE